MRNAVRRVIVALDGHSIVSVLSTLLHDSYFITCPSRVEFLHEWLDFLHFAAQFPELSTATHDVCADIHIEALTSEVANLANKESGWHFSARKTCPEQVEAFSLPAMAKKLEMQAPCTWNLLGSLLHADSSHARKRMQFLGITEAEVTAPTSCQTEPSPDEWDEEDEYWEVLGVVIEDGVVVDDQTYNDRPNKRRRRAGERYLALLRIKRVVIMSVMLQSTNQKCNALASTIGLFLHSTSAPELVIEVLAHSGLSISVSAIHAMVNSLSVTSSERLRTLAKTLLATFAYDNFDMDFKSWVSTVERPGSTLRHGTSALAFSLAHGVCADDLKCASELWSTDPLNPHIPASQHRQPRSWIDCLPKAESLESPQGPCLQHRILAWHFRNALVSYCKEFKHFQSELGLPETINQIPVVKTSHIPCRAMDINQSTNDGQGQIIENIFTQANLGDPTDTPGVEDIREHVVLVHGDLGTGERIAGIKRSRAIETKPVRTLQLIIFIFGLFHLLMACADAIWKMFIEPKDLRSSPDSLYQHACKIRPHDSGRIGTKPGFRLVHDLVHQSALARMIDVWCVEIKMQKGHESLADYAVCKPSWDKLTALSLQLVEKYLDKPQHPDALFRNNSLMLTRMLQYIELAHAMKYGDIGRVEATFLHWVFVFKAVGKHKYAAALIKVMNDLKYTYPAPLAKAIRLNWLCNPSGKRDGFRAIDWLVELMNLYIKVVYGSSGFAWTFQLILKQSPLIEIFRHVHTLMQDTFHLLHHTVRHAPPDLNHTVKVLGTLLQESHAHIEEAGRKSFKLMDHFREGMRILQTGIYRKGTTGSETASGQDDLGLQIDDLDLQW